jgi:hypothetical protein
MRRQIVMILTVLYDGLSRDVSLEQVAATAPRTTFLYIAMYDVFLHVTVIVSHTPVQEAETFLFCADNAIT